MKWLMASPVGGEVNESIEDSALAGIHPFCSDKTHSILRPLCYNFQQVSKSNLQPC